MAQVYNDKVQLQPKGLPLIPWVLVVIIFIQVAVIAWLTMYPYGGAGEICGYVRSVVTPATHGYHGVLINTTHREPEVFESSPVVTLHATNLVSRYGCFDVRPLPPWHKTRYFLDSVSLR